MKFFNKNRTDATDKDVFGDTTNQDFYADPYGASNHGPMGKGEGRWSVNILQILWNAGPDKFSIAIGKVESASFKGNAKTMLVIRWNGADDDDDTGFPKNNSRQLDWMPIPGEFTEAILERMPLIFKEYIDQAVDQDTPSA